MVTLQSGASFPHPIGLEAAGVIDKVGAGVSNWQVGDRVMLNNSVQAKGGTWAEFAVVPATAPIIIPNELGFNEAAALPVAGGTALESIRSLGLNEGNTVFIAGASGAIGTLAIQPGTALPSLPVVKDGGRIVTVSGDQVLAERGVRVEQIGHHPEKQRDLAELAAAAGAGSIRVVVERVYPFEEALDALAKTETRHARGKLVVKVGRAG